MTALNKQALRQSAEKAQEHGVFNMDIHSETVLALLDELEAKDKSISFLKDQLAQLANFNPDWDKLEAATDSLREHMAELTAARKRIAELEAVTSEQRAEHDAGMKEFAAMLQGAEPVQEWIPCSERMPDVDTRVLLYFPDYGGHIEDGCIGDEGDGPYHYFFDGDSLRHEPTHWMPLPAAPKQEVKHG